MILSLRQRHRRVFMALGIFLPVAFVAGIAARRSVPVAELPAALSAGPQSYAAMGQPYNGLFQEVPVRTQFWRQPGQVRQFAVSFAADKSFLKPDLLVYWVAGEKNTNSLPDDAILLGAFGQPALPLPEAASKSEGVLMLYSLADGEVVDVSQSVSPQLFNAATP